jgi:hypothetical protein
MLRAIVAVVLQLLLVLTLSRQAAGQAAAHLDGAQTHGHAHIRAAEGSQLALDFLTLADGLLRERKRRAPHFTATVTYASLMASIRSEAEFRALYRLTHSEYIDLHKKICQHDPTYSGGQHARGLDSRLKLLSALRFLAGGDVKDVLIAHGQSTTTFWRHLEATMNAILVLYPLELNLDDPAKLAELEQCCCEGRLFDPSKSKAYRGCIGFLASKDYGGSPAAARCACLLPLPLLLLLSLPPLRHDHHHHHDHHHRHSRCCCYYCCCCRVCWGRCRC